MVREGQIIEGEDQTCFLVHQMTPFRQGLLDVEETVVIVLPPVSALPDRLPLPSPAAFSEDQIVSKKKIKQDFTRSVVEMETIEEDPCDENRIVSSLIVPLHSLLSNPSSSTPHVPKDLPNKEEPLISEDSSLWTPIKAQHLTSKTNKNEIISRRFASLFKSNVLCAQRDCIVTANTLLNNGWSSGSWVVLQTTSKEGRQEIVRVISNTVLLSENKETINEEDEDENQLINKILSDLFEDDVLYLLPLTALKFGFFPTSQRAPRTTILKASDARKHTSLFKAFINSSEINGTKGPIAPAKQAQSVKVSLVSGSHIQDDLIGHIMALRSTEFVDLLVQSSFRRFLSFPRVVSVGDVLALPVCYPVFIAPLLQDFGVFTLDDPSSGSALSSELIDLINQQDGPEGNEDDFITEIVYFSVTELSPSREPFLLLSSSSELILQGSENSLLPPSLHSLLSGSPGLSFFLSSFFFSSSDTH